MRPFSEYEPLAPCPSPFNMAAHVLAGGALKGDKTALQGLRLDQGRLLTETWSYRRLIAAVRGFGTGLRQLGLQPDDRIILALGNDPSFAVAFLGAIAAGVVPVPVSTQLTEREMTAIADQIAPSLVVMSRATLPADLACPLMPAESVADLAQLAPCAWAMGDPDRLAWMSYTSGTGGQPRAVMHAHRSVWARQSMLRGWTDLRETDRMLHASAFNWTYAIGVGLLDPLTVGATALIPADGTTPADLPRMLAETEATLFAAAPAAFRRTLTHPLPAMPRLRHALSAGEKLPPAIAAQWQQATGTCVHEAYGLSECSTLVSGSTHRPARAGTLGFAQPGRRVAVLGAEGQRCASDEPGELAIDRNDPGLFLGYFGAPEETKARFAGDWFLTGDGACMAADGAITYLGRVDDMMNAGGLRVSPIEVEEAMADFPGLSEVAAVELTVRSGVSVIACFYVSASLPAEDALIAHAAGRLARYKQPRLFIRTDALPRGATNKLLRKQLRAQWESTHAEA
jgi:acyl-coenzyme A synthetase/AMP-(fatty) acid ligase